MPRLTAETVAALPEAGRSRFYASLTPQEHQALLYRWDFWARDSQLQPPLEVPGLGLPWRTWLILAGRGYGKTRVGAETVRSWVESGRCRRLALVARTSADVRDVVVEGESGLLSVCPPSFKPKWEPSKRRLTWPNGAVATTYTGDEPDQLRGPQHDGAWCDELAAWRYPEAWDMLQMGLRLGSTPQAVVTTTPRPTKLIKDLVKDASTVVTRGSTYENRANLAPSFFNFITNRYEGTRLGRQELRAELLEDVPGALWGRDNLDLHRVRTLTKVPQFSRIAVALDPSATKGGDEAGIVCSALEFLTPEQQLERLPHVYVLDDASQQASPQGWASAAVSLFHTRQAHVLVAESNNGGEMVSTTISTIPNAPPVHLIHASLGKQARAEPISGLYEQGRVHHVGAFPQLEDEMCEWVPASGLPSPNRLDALVWSITELVFGEFSIMPSALAGRPRSAGAGRRVVLAR